MNKKGQTVIDVLLVMLILLVVSVGSIFAHFIITEVNSDVQADSDMHTEAKSSLRTVTDNFPQTFDNAFLIMLILFWVLLIVTSVFIDTNPIFFVLVCVLLTFLFVIGMVVSNVYSDILTDSGQLSTFAAAFPTTHFVMGHLLLFLMGMGFTSAIALYAKVQGGAL